MPDSVMAYSAADVTLETSPSTAALDEALAKAQGEIETASKDKNNPAFRAKYADLTSVWEACRPALSKNGIALTQWPLSSADNRLHIITRIAHKGEWMQARFSIPVDKANAHGVGSAITYAKRYTLSAALGVVADDDDDGNAAARAPARSPGNAQTESLKVDLQDLDMVKGDGRNQYETDKLKKAETFVTNALGTFALPGQAKDSLNQWWKDNTKFIDRLEGNYPNLHERLVVAFDKAMDDAATRVAA